MNKFDQKLFNALGDFRSLAVDTIQDGPRTIPRISGANIVDVKSSKIASGLNLICPKTNFEKYKENFFNHFSELGNYLTFCSSPQAFRSAWNLRSEKLNNYDALSLINEGAQLIPVNNDSRVFRCEQQGVLYGAKKRLILGVRHSEGNYEDELNDVGQFDYQPPIDCSGLLRYRWCHYLSEKLNIPYILLVIIWFEYRINDNLNHAFVIAPAKIINSKNQLNNLDKHIQKPLKLQIISRQEAVDSLLVLESRKDSIDDITVRNPLSDTLSREWSYSNINNSEKGRKIKKWAIKNGKKCPGDICNNKPFKEISLSKIAFGHIISQKWSSAFTYLLKTVHHPDNLYLTCSSCNSSLGDKFPPSQLRNKIVEFGTIGDWIRAKEKQIRDL
jgi:hypothetical protein